MTSNPMRFWLVLVFLVVFTGGVGAGVLVSNWRSRPAGPPRFERQGPGFPAPGPRGGALLGRMSNQLDLTEEQRDQLEQVLDAQRERMRAFHADVRERFEAEQGEIRAEIEGILTPDQQERFEELTRRRGRRMGTPPRDNRFRRPRRDRF